MRSRSRDPEALDMTATFRPARFLLVLILGASLTLPTLEPPAGPCAAEEKSDRPVPHVTRVSPPEAFYAVEVSVAIDPTNPDHLVAASQGALKKHPGVGCLAYVTQDAGRTWKTVPRPNARGVEHGDDALTFTAEGLAVHACISFTGIRVERPKKAHTGIVTFSSRDGLTWGEQVAVVEHFNSVEPFEDKPWLRADRSPDSHGKGNVYVVWTRFDVYGSEKPEHKSHVYFSRSLDLGMTFSVPLKISDVPGDALDKSDTVMGACPAVGPHGEVYAAWAGPGGIFFTSSTDYGFKFGKTRLITDSAMWEFPVKGLGRANGCAFLSADISRGKDRGSLYVTWGDTRNGDPDVFLIVSRDGGQTWSKPQRVNNDPKGKEQWFPTLSVDPVDGSVNVAYYDRAARDGTLTDLTLARSVDGGRTFVHHKLNPEAYDLDKVGFFGDYIGLDSFAGRVAVLWMHPVDAAKKLGISSAILDFEPGTQRAREKK
jgi:hypothetical protein